MELGKAREVVLADLNKVEVTVLGIDMESKLGKCMLQCIESFYLSPVLVHLSRYLAQCSLANFKVRFIEETLMVSLEFPKGVNSIRGYIVRLDMMWVAEQKKVFVGTTIFIALLGVISFVSRERRLNMAGLADELIPVVDKLVYAAGEGALISRACK
ncbi:MAG: hypothetical protein KAR40_07640 [Candidatus Sabulitectum sp.]|nr:hypothetical protein [Candidatus Sabulitectum sp.]